ncbi:MAG: DNA polymerase III subunit beta [Petrotogales bacterium]
MEFSIKKSDILSKLETVSSAVASKTVKPVLSGILFRVVGEKKIELLATDLETSIKTFIEPDSLSGDGAFVVEAKVLLEIARSLREGTINFNIEENNLNIEMGQSFFTLPSMDASEFPEISPTEGGIKLETSVTNLELMIERSIFCAAKDEFMRNLNGIYWELEDGYLRLVGADGFRLALVEKKIDTDVEDHFLIALKSMKDLQTSIKNASSDKMLIEYDGSRVGFYFNDTEIIARVVDAEFPDYKKVLPKAFKTKIVVDSNDFMDAVKRTSITARLGSESVKLEIVEDTMQLLAKSPEHGEANEELKVKKDGEDLTIAFNPKFLLESMKNIDADETELNFVDSNSPLQMNPVDVEGYLYIIMPIRLI